MNASHTALYPMGPQAGHIYNLWWFLFWLALTVWVVTVAVMLVSVFRKRLETAEPPRTEGAINEDTRAVSRAVTVAGVLTVLALFAVLVVSVSTGSVLSSRPNRDVLSIDVTANQWWWQAVYEDTIPANMITTANEIHVPVGKPVIVKTTSHDVIHSFFIPNLYG